MPLVTLHKAKQVLGITDSNQDDRIAGLLGPVTALAERIAGRPFTQATRTEDHFGGNRSIFLRVIPVASITSVVELLGNTTIAATGYSVDTTNGILRRLPLGSRWLPVGDNIPTYRVTYVGGPTSVPEDVQLACIEIVGMQLRGQGDLISESEGDYSYSRGLTPEGLPASVLSVLRSHRLSF